MRIRCRLAVPLVLFAALESAAQQTQTPGTVAPQLKLEVVPVKSAFRIGERVVVKYHLTSLVDGTLCFPPPAIGVSGSFGGNVRLEARARNGAAEQDFFIEHIWPRHPTEEELRASVADRWIKLGMAEPYRLREPDKVVVLRTPGEWELQATYYPPDLTARDKEIVRSMGCTPPDVPVKSDPIVVNVVDSSD